MNSRATTSRHIRGLRYLLATWLAIATVASWTVHAAAEVKSGFPMAEVAPHPSRDGELSSQQVRDKERSRVVAERQAADRSFEREEAACRAQFFETDCVNAARGKRRSVMDDLRRQEVALNDAERRESAARSDQRIRDKDAERQSAARVEREIRAKEQDARRLERVNQRAADREARRPEVSQRAAKQKITVTKKIGEGQKALEDKSVRAAQVLTDQAANEQKFAQRKADAQARQATSGKPPGAPLTVPPAPNAPIPAAVPLAATPTQSISR